MLHSQAQLWQKGLMHKRVTPDHVFAHTPQEIAEWQGDARFPLTEANGAIPPLCEVGLKMAVRGDCLDWSLFAYRAQDHWEVFHAWHSQDGQMMMNSNDPRWDGDEVLVAEQIWPPPA